MEVREVLSLLENQLAKSEAELERIRKTGDEFDRGWWGGNASALRTMISIIRMEVKG